MIAIVKLDNIKQVVQSSSVIEVNAFLARGFKILKVFSCKESTESSERIFPCYVLVLCNNHGDNIDA